VKIKELFEKGKNKNESSRITDTEVAPFHARLQENEKYANHALKRDSKSHLISPAAIFLF